MLKFNLIFAITATFLIGCSGSMKPEDFSKKEPRFVLEEYFIGRTQASGIFEDRFGNLRRQFSVDIDGTWDGNILVLDEQFSYADGEKDQRVWRITKLDDHTYEGTASDIIGTASGRSFGNALNWQYYMDLKVGDGRWRVYFDDWMFLQPGGTLLNRATVKKWGVRLGDVTLSFKKVPHKKVAYKPDQTELFRIPQQAVE